MKDVSNKIKTQRTATAEASVSASPEAIAAAKAGNTPKGAVWDIARAAGVLAAKRTAELIPYCHQIPLDHIEINFEPTDSAIKIRAVVKAIWKTGVEMEALTAVSMAALTVYDMLKPIDNGVKISDLRLVEKKGGKSDFQTDLPKEFTAAVIVTSDSVSKGSKDDKSGRLIVERLKCYGVDVKTYLVLPDEKDQIIRTIKAAVKEGVHLIVTTGGTGLGPRDVTVEAIKEIIEREAPGISEAVHSFGQQRTPYAMLSRGIAGTIGKTLIITLPGSSRGVKESLDAIFPYIFHIYPMLEGKGH
ncbi:MAG: bifunctional molybdenum cofactor biosynthesis protein MoaC/MoaB [Deltaproteobacteria bacterium RIFCSPLOWO2_02_FULL_47_10]|nr:MAG: bifunctional molybdenum cofactor biosynthesis protein MoaC/MoaB [Deltaproteobacteria bacterium RIFCSPLOWO2_02_FULL_47_10]